MPTDWKGAREGIASRLRGFMGPRDAEVIAACIVEQWVAPAAEVARKIEYLDFGGGSSPECDECPGCGFERHTGQHGSDCSIADVLAHLRGEEAGHAK